MAVDDHGIEVLKKAGEEVVPGSKADYYIKVKTITGSVVNAAQTPTIYNVPVPTADTEVSQAILDGTKRILIKTRGPGSLKLSYVATESGTKYITIGGNASKDIDNLNTSSLTLYFQSPLASQTVEIETWVQKRQRNAES